MKKKFKSWVGKDISKPKTIKEKVLDEMNVNTINPRIDCVRETVFVSDIIDLTIKHILKLISKEDDEDEESIIEFKKILKTKLEREIK